MSHPMDRYADAISRMAEAAVHVARAGSGGGYPARLAAEKLRRVADDLELRQRDFDALLAATLDDWPR